MKSIPIVATALAVLCSLAPASATQAEEGPAYLVFTKATQKGEQVQVETRIIHRTGDKKAPRPKTVQEAARDPNASVLTAPRVTLRDGSRGHILVGSERPAIPGKPKPPMPGGLWEGVRVDIIKPLNQSKVLVITTVMEKGTVVFADAQNVAVTVRPKAPPAEEK